MTTLSDIIAAISIVALVFAAAAGISAYQCHARWSDAYPVKWEFFAGCRVQVNGKWIPATAIREI